MRERFVIFFLGFYAAGLMFSQRAMLSVAIVSMVKVDNKTGHDAGACYFNDRNNTAHSDHDSKHSGTYEWSETLQGVILGAQAYPTIIMPLVSGWLADKFGAKWPTAIAVMGPGLLASLIPFVADVHAYLLIALLTLMGAMGASVFPVLFSLYSNWFPANEMATATGALAFGANLGLVLMFLGGGYLVQFLGWPSVFYMSTLTHIPWFLAWICLAGDSPITSKTISQKELEYIKSKSMASRQGDVKVPIPWGQIIKSKAVWGSIVGKFSESFGLYLLMTKMPAYLDLVFGIPIHDNGVLNALVHLSSAMTEMVGGPLSTFVFKQGVISLTTTRKLFQTVGLIGPAVCFVMIPMVGCDSMSVYGLLICSMLLYGLVTGGEWSITSELAPDFVGTVFGFSYIIGISASFIAPIIAGVILDKDPGDKERWNMVFYITVGVYVIGSFLFNILASADPQPWGVIEKKPQQEMEKKPKAIKI